VRIEELDYQLPDELIAQEPLADRSASRLLCLDRVTGSVRHRVFTDLLDELHPDDLLVMNNTRVSALRLFGRKSTGGEVEALVLKEIEEGLFECLLRPAKRLKPGTEVAFAPGLTGVVQEGGTGPTRLLCLKGDDWRHQLDVHGAVPLPPYILSAKYQRERYQTVYSERPGSAAAPTAGLHFTAGLLEAIKDKGVSVAFVTLDVSLDTFRPVQADRVEDHAIHGEFCEMPEITANAINTCQGRVVAVGTTSVRTIESFSEGRRTVRPGRKMTSIFITPGYGFRNVDAILTNFHMPRTTMLAMLAAFTPKDYLFRAYEAAVEARYRFLSFGDAMLLA